jgi:glutamate racemase
VCSSDLNILGEKVTIIDPAPAIARHTSDVVQQMKQNVGAEARKGHSVFLTTGNVDKMKSILSMISISDYEVQLLSI